MEQKIKIYTYKELCEKFQLDLYYAMDKKFYFDFEFRNSLKGRFKYILLFPTIDITWDTQLDTGLIEEGNVDYFGYKELLIGFIWLGFTFQFSFSFRTKKFHIRP
jgi:hypothetical protein